MLNQPPGASDYCHGDLYQLSSTLWAERGRKVAAGTLSGSEAGASGEFALLSFLPYLDVGRL